MNETGRRGPPGPKGPQEKTRAMKIIEDTDVTQMDALLRNPARRTKISGAMQNYSGPVRFFSDIFYKMGVHGVPVNRIRQLSFYALSFQKGAKVPYEQVGKVVFAAAEKVLGAEYAAYHARYLAEKVQVGRTIGAVREQTGTEVVQAKLPVWTERHKGPEGRVEQNFAASAGRKRVR